MKRRVMCVLLSALILMRLLPNIAVPARAADLTTSDACVEILKSMEGFLKYPKYDHGQYSIGYGCGCDPKDYPNGITEEEAEELLREYLVVFEKAVNGLAKRYSLTFTQNEFDALILFTYNVGGNWVNADGAFRQAVINGARGNSFIYPFCMWSTASGELSEHLVKRRLIEADMYLNGSYANKQPINYTYVIFDNNGGISDVKVQGYDANQITVVKPIPILTGSRFLGWYTAENGGEWVTNLTASHGGKTLYAHWQKNGTAQNAATAVSYKRSASQLSSNSVYDAPGGKAVGTVAAGTTLEIVADYVDSANTKWGKLPNGKWVNLGNCLVGVVSAVPDGSVEVTVNAAGINVRTGPGIEYDSVGLLGKGNKVKITETRIGGTQLWGRFSGGWIALRYTNYTQITGKDTIVEPEEDDTPTTVIATGTVVNCTALRIRAGAGTNYPSVGGLNAGAKVQITQKKTVDGVVWGRISQGWISMNYVRLDAAVTQPDNGNTDSTEPTEPKENVTGKSGTVISNTGLNVRSDAGTQHAIVGGYKPGDKVTILEQKSSNGTVWGRTDKGWISMQYVKLDTADTTGGTQEKPDNNGGNATETANVYGTVTTKTGLIIRKGPGTNHASIGGYSFGTRILILEKTAVNGVAWGRTDKGWVCLNYVKLETAGTTGGTTSGTTGGNTGSTQEKPGETTGGTSETTQVYGTVNTKSGLIIRKGPGTNHASIGGYTHGTRIQVLEKTTVNGVAWGRTDKGWVCLSYVILSGDVPETEKPDTGNDTTGEESKPSTVTGGNALVISNTALNVRSGPGTDYAMVGNYNRGDRITILEQKTVGAVAWGKTDKGWVCMTYVQLDSNASVRYSAVITASSLAIRSKAGTEGEIVGFYKNGETVEILQTTYVNSQAWGKTNKGWICLAYVKK